MTDLVDAAATGEPAAVAKITAGDIKAALRVHFADPAYAVFFEVSNDTGARGKTYTDAIAMGIWPSTGQEIVGIEIKVSRSDWLREIKNPAKTSPMFEHCDRFYLACPQNMVSAAEVPQNWGVLHLASGKLRIAKKAPPLNPRPVSRGLMAAIIRRAGAADTEIISAAVSKAVAVVRAAQKAEIESAVKFEIGSHRNDISSAKAKLAKIEEITGIRMDGWSADAETVGRAIKAVHESGVEASFNRLQTLGRDLKSAAEGIEKALAAAGVRVSA